MNPNPRIQKYCNKVLGAQPNREEPAPDVDCCKWRDKIEKLLGKKKKKAKPKKKKNDDPSCCKKKDEIPDKKAKLAACCKTKKKKKKKVTKEKKKAAKMENCRDIINRLYSCVKPSVPVRDQLISGRHILCILDDLETVEYCRMKELRKKCDEDPTMPPDCKPMEEPKKCELPQVAKKKSDTNDDKKKCKLITGISRKCIYKKFTQSSKKPKKPRDDCDCLRYNFSRCSLDSDVDVGDFKLTEEEIKKIEKNRKKVGAAASKNKDLNSVTMGSTVNDITKDSVSELETRNDTLDNEMSLDQDKSKLESYKTI